MDAEAAAPVVWVAPPSADARRGLARWSATRGIVTREPAEEGAPALPWDVADAVERGIAEAREAVLAGEGARADRALDQAERALRAAAQLPNAAWLLAEVERARAARFADAEPRDLARAARAWHRAEDLDGGRAPGIGEPGPGKDAPRAPRTEPRIVLLGPATGALVEVDGAPLRAPIAEGEHQVRVLRGAAIAWAGWAMFAPGGEVRLTLPGPAPCSRDDLGSGAVRCARWITAREVPGGLDVALCGAAACGPPTRYARALDAQTTDGGPPDAPRRAAWPAWATWTLVGAGIAGGTFAVLAASGAFAEPPAEVRFVGGGVRPAARTGL